mgnify:CR=1 FL=1
MSEAEKTSKPGFFKSVKSEFKKCTWPKKEDLVKQSALVIVVSVLLGVLIAGVDWQQVKGHDLTKWGWQNEPELRPENTQNTLLTQ